MKAFVRPRAWSLLATIIFLFLAPLIFSITVRLNPFLLFYNQLDEFAKLSIQADNVHPEIVNMFMICDNFDGNPYPGVYMGSKIAAFLNLIPFPSNKIYSFNRLAREADCQRR